MGHESIAIDEASFQLDSQNSLTFKHFLRTLFDRLNKKKRYLLVLDNVGYHKTSCIKNLLQEYVHISIEYLPPYSPKLNPIETCWKVTKNRVTKSQYFENIDEMQNALENFWEEQGRTYFYAEFYALLMSLTTIQKDL